MWPLIPELVACSLRLVEHFGVEPHSVAVLVVDVVGAAVTAVYTIASSVIVDFLLLLLSLLALKY